MNPYEVLGVDPSTSLEEIKKVYRKLAIENHPDKHGGDDSKMKEINAAWDLIKNPRPSNSSDPDPRSRDHDIFGQFFRQTNPNIAYQYAISLEEAFSGKEDDIEFELPEGGRRKVHVKIPAGVPSGIRMQFHGLGSQRDPNLPPGNLFLQIIIRPHKKFHVHHRDLFQELDIDVLDVMQGSRKKVKCLDGSEINVKIPEGAFTGQQLRCEGKGMPVPGSETKGDMYVVLNLKTPILNNRQKELLEDLRNAK